MYNLSLCKWGEFLIGTLFSINSGKSLTKVNMIPGKRPFIGATDSNNGITEWVDNVNESVDKNVLGVNFNGSVGETFYHPYECIFSSDVKRLHLLNGVDSKYVLLFLKTMILQQKGKYSYGYKFGERRMRRQKILLPVTSDGKPDWGFMESYMKVIEQRLLKETIYVLRESINNSGNGLSIDSSYPRWSTFYFTDIFTKIKRGKRLKKLNHIAGYTPYVSSTATNNGVDQFIGNKSNVRKFSNCITVANSGSVGYSFFHKYEFVASDHVTQLKRDGLNKYVYIFMLPIINRLSDKYSFNREITDERIKRERFILPITTDNKPDWQYMENYMRDIEQRQLRQVTAALIKRLQAE